MGAISAVYCRTRAWSTPLLRLAMWSPWSHVAPIVGDEEDSIIDATFAHGGVRRRKLSDLLADCSAYEIRSIEVPDPVAGWDFLRSQIGKPYDVLGVLGIGLHREWQSADAWFCSELWEQELAAAGRQRFEHYAERVTPQLSYMVR